jgi:VEFS-Box of polycomb protein
MTPAVLFVNLSNARTVFLLQLHLLASKKTTFDTNWQPFDDFHEVFEANVSLPRRPYFRDVTFDEIALSEWLFDRKDESLDPQWHGIVEDSVSAGVIRTTLCFKRKAGRRRNHATLTHTFVYLDIRMKALYELTDVTSKEKHFFLMWNDFMRKNPVLSEVQLSDSALRFVREYSFAIVDHRLEEQLIAHVTNMWYEGVIGRRVLVDCMDLFNQLEVQRRTGK